MRVCGGGALERAGGSDDSSEHSSGSSEQTEHLTRKLTCRVCIREATGLPARLSNFVFCQYSFWEQAEPTVAPPLVSPDTPPPSPDDANYTVRFHHCRDYVVSVSEELVEYISEGCLAIEV
ncbi:kinesin-like protein KIF13A [Engraulis encrasicolus]|uniref:kinesin-like protein KIF13A n=1 Tax=Engraulis encrasicolus TaxID=184585 RepID=UPI002FD6ED09